MQTQANEGACAIGDVAFWAGPGGIEAVTFDESPAGYGQFLYVMNMLSLVDGNGAPVTFTSVADFYNFFNGPESNNAQNIPYQLSRQLAAFSLDYVQLLTSTDPAVAASWQCGLSGTGVDLIGMADIQLAGYLGGETPLNLSTATTALSDVPLNLSESPTDMMSCLVETLRAANAAISVEFGCAKAECQPCDGKVTQLTLYYSGDDAHIVAVAGKKKSPQVVFDGSLTAGDSFTIVGQDDNGTLGVEVNFYVVTDTGCYREIASIHTSCSQPIGPGLVAGPFTVLEGYSLNGGLLCEVQEPPPADCQPCDGKVTSLTIQYTGADTPVITVLDKRGNELGTVQLDGTGIFTVDGADLGVDDKGTLGTQITLLVNGVETASIHTSCSQPIGPGMVFGPFTILEGYSRNGGLLCPEDGTQETCDKDCDKGGKDCSNDKDKDKSGKDCSNDKDKDKSGKDCSNDKDKDKSGKDCSNDKDKDKSGKDCSNDKDKDKSGKDCSNDKDKDKSGKDCQNPLKDWNDSFDTAFGKKKC
ncbi:MAG: hypothetical protein H7A46_10815 [Verrucomicrobiales bacterium]|nr:hypothetical protein [Verrucomicrobiales bacterium]